MMKQQLLSTSSSSSWGCIFWLCCWLSTTVVVAAFSSRAASRPPPQPTTTQTERDKIFCIATTTTRRPRRTRTTTSSLKGVIQSGDTVLVVGGTGGVGQLVTQKLLTQNQYSVRVTTRDSAASGSSYSTVNAAPAVEVVPVDLVQGSEADLLHALEGVAGLVITVGTTAFPTLKWQNGNTPEAIDHMAVARLVRVAATMPAVPTLKKVVLVTSVGVNRIRDFPFVILNLFGVLDAKRKGEDALKQQQQRQHAAASSWDYVIVRPGRLVGAPFTNWDVARLLQIEGGNGGSTAPGIKCAPGDALLGDCQRQACAEAIVRALQSKEARNIEFCVISAVDDAADDVPPLSNDDEWDALFQSLQQQ